MTVVVNEYIYVVNSSRKSQQTEKADKINLIRPLQYVLFRINMLPISFTTF